MTVRVAVVGNCAAPGLARAIQALSPDAFVQHFSINEIHFLESSIIKDIFKGFDVSLSVAEISSYATLNEEVSKIGRTHLWPSIVFTGYHPDIMYLDFDGRAATSHFGPYHSRIAAVAYATELSVEDTAERFNALTFGRLGYFDAYALGKNQFLSTANHYGLDVEEDFARWEQAGPFMYTINHPKMSVINDIARKLIKASGLELNGDNPVEEAEPDYFADNIIWPIYPEIAQRLGNLSGSYEFKQVGHLTAGVPSLHLEEFIDKCFRKYADSGLTSDRFRTRGVLKVYGPLLDIEPRT
jgi:hypothetical protein